MSQRFGTKDLLSIISGSTVVFQQLPPLSSPDKMVEGFSTMQPTTLAGTLFIAANVIGTFRSGGSELLALTRPLFKFIRSRPMLNTRAIKDEHQPL